MKRAGLLGLSRQQRGTSTLEFVVVLPVLLFVFLAGLELSRAWLTINITTNAVREGARVGAASNPVLSPPGSSPVSYAFDNTLALVRVNQVLTSANLTPVIVSVTCIPAASPPAGTAGCTPDSEIQAFVEVNFATVAPLFLPMLASRVIQETARMRRE